MIVGNLMCADLPGNTKGKDSKNDAYRVSTLPKLRPNMMKWISKVELVDEEVGEDDDESEF